MSGTPYHAVIHITFSGEVHVPLTRELYHKLLDASAAKEPDDEQKRLLCLVTNGC